MRSLYVAGSRFTAQCVEPVFPFLQKMFAPRISQRGASVGSRSPLSDHGGWLYVLCPYCGKPTPYRLNAHFLDAPFRCGNCRTLDSAQAPYFVKKKVLTLKQRSAITRLRLHYYSSCNRQLIPIPSHAKHAARQIEFADTFHFQPEQC